MCTSPEGCAPGEEPEEQVPEQEEGLEEADLLVACERVVAGWP